LKEMFLKWLNCIVFLISQLIPGTFWSYHVQSLLCIKYYCS
jgi:hypothetical protein